MLGVYYQASSQRSSDELDRFAGRRVRIVARFHSHTPEQHGPNGEVLATMIGSYLDDIESIAEQPGS
jgi:hypothetical protein